MKQLLVLAVLAAAIGGCAKNDNPASTGSTGTMQVAMIDAPNSAYDSIVVTVTSVQVHSTESSDGWITLSNEAHSYNLLSLVNGTEAMIGQTQLSAGHYTQIRLVVGDTTWAYIGGVRLSVKVPSTEIKLNVDATIEANVTYKMVLDFDAMRSLVSAGTGLIMKPVIRVATTAQTGFITGMVNVQSAVFAYGASDTLSTVTDSTGAFTVMYVPQGTYDVEIVPADDSYYNTTINGVVVTAGDTKNIGDITLQKK